MRRAIKLPEPCRGNASVAILLCLIAAGYQSTSAPAERIVVTTPIGRKVQVTRQYTIKEVEDGAAAFKTPTNPFDIQHPVFPKKNEIEELRPQLKVGDQVWYFQGLDSGWALVRSGKVIWILVTNHEY